MTRLFTRANGRRFAFGASFLVVGGVAAVNSYSHMKSVALLGHQGEFLASTLPLSVDGLMVIASLAAAEDKAQGRSTRPWARFAFWFGAVISLVANIASTAVHYGDLLSIGAAAWSPIALLIAVEIMAKPGKAKAVAAVSAPLVSAATPASPQPIADVVAEAEEITAAAVTERPVWLPERTAPQWTPLNQRTRKAA